MLPQAFGDRILGPESPGIARINNLFIKKILIKIEKDASADYVKQKINEYLMTFKQTYKSVLVQIDVDVI